MKRIILILIVFHEVAELKKCKQDIFYFAEKYCMIKTDEDQYTHFKLKDS